MVRMYAARRSQRPTWASRRGRCPFSLVSRGFCTTAKRLSQPPSRPSRASRTASQRNLRWDGARASGAPPLPVNGRRRSLLFYGREARSPPEHGLDGGVVAETALPEGMKVAAGDGGQSLRGEHVVEVAAAAPTPPAPHPAFVPGRVPVQEPVRVAQVVLLQAPDDAQLGRSPALVALPERHRGAVREFLLGRVEVAAEDARAVRLPGETLVYSLERLDFHQPVRDARREVRVMNLHLRAPGVRDLKAGPTGRPSGAGLLASFWE